MFHSTNFSILRSESVPPGESSDFRSSLFPVCLFRLVATFQRKVNSANLSHINNKPRISEICGVWQLTIKVVRCWCLFFRNDINSGSHALIILHVSVPMRPQYFRSFTARERIGFHHYGWWKLWWYRTGMEFLTELSHINFMRAVNRTLSFHGCVWYLWCASAWPCFRQCMKLSIP